MAEIVIIHGIDPATDQPVAITVVKATGAVLVSGALAISPGSAVDQGAAGATPWLVTLSVDSVGLSKDATLTGGTAKAIMRGGSKGATSAADVTSTANGADHQAADVAEAFAPVAEDNVNGVIAYVEKPTATATYAPSLATDFGVSTKTNIKAIAGNVIGILVTNANLMGRWFQLHNKASTPAAAEVPLYSIWVGPGASLPVGRDFFTGSGGAFTTGIGFAWSTTGPTFTDAATAADHTTHIHYK